jgi:SAM-dependent methyltransferase
MRLRRLVPKSVRGRLKAELSRLLATEQPPAAALKYVPAVDGSDTMSIGASRRAGGVPGTGLPVPPEHLWIGYGATTDEYLASGREHVERMRQILAAHDFEIPAKSRILDFGCGAGRMIRWLEREAEQGETWGCDISGDHIHWAQQNLRPPFRFFTCTSLPTLPFADGQFDLVYAGSVFTHVGDLAQAWLLELRRVLRPGGHAYLTVHDRHTSALMATEKHSSAHASQTLAESGGLPEDFGMLVLRRWPEGGRTLVFFDHDWLRDSLEPMFRVVAFEPEAYGYQTAVVAEAV